MILLLFLKLSFAQIVGGWYFPTMQPLADPGILAFGSASIGHNVTFLTADRDQPAWLIAASDQAQPYTLTQIFGPTAIFAINGLIYIQQATPFSSGAELSVVVPIPNNPSLIGVKFRFQFLSIVNGAWKTSLPWEIEVVP